MIALNSVTKKFGTFTAVDNITYRVEKGEYFALLGPNGAGKTTVVRMLLGFIKPSSGSITIDGPYNAKGLGARIVDPLHCDLSSSPNLVKTQPT